jgi:hypothetical protein
MSKYDKFATQLGFKDKPKDNTLLSNLTRTPKRDDKTNMPTTQNPNPFVDQQADLLFLPNDRGYRYALVVVDIATRKTDAEPIKNKLADTVLKAMKNIYNRKILKVPKILEVDSGSEFKGVFEQYYENILKLRVKEPGRHRQQSVVETRNGLISKTLQKRMLAQEVNTNQESNEWVDFLPQVIRAINDHYTQQPHEIPADTPIRCSGEACHILPLGTMVRVQLDNPVTYVDEARLHGKFGIGDIRWTKEVYPITQLFLRPGQPPMYQVNDNESVAYTRNQFRSLSSNSCAVGAILTRHIVVARLGRYPSQSEASR